MNSQQTPNQAQQLWNYFTSICDCGGRLCGTDSERSARTLLQQLGTEVTGATCQSIPVPYLGWRATKCALTGPDGAGLTCHPLIRSAATPPGGLEAPVVDVGRGTREEFAAHAAEIPGCIVMARHEQMFAAGTIHRGIKYRAAVEAGAVGFVIVGPLAQTPVAGSSGRGDEVGIPAVGVSRDAASTLVRTASGRPVAHLLIETEEAPAEVSNLLFDMPGETDEWVVLSAHIDGHDLAESAIDNATGLAVALAVAAELAPAMSGARRGLRLALFNVEEWALTGSAQYVDRLSARGTDAIALNVNLDSIGVGSRLTALTSGYVGVEEFLLEQAERSGVALNLYRPLQMNSDHANFARADVPAFRLVAGFNDATAPTRFVLTAEDTRDKVSLDSLHEAARLVRQTVAAALDASTDQVAAWRDQR